MIKLIIPYLILLYAVRSSLPDRQLDTCPTANIKPPLNFDCYQQNYNPVVGISKQCINGLGKFSTCYKEHGVNKKSHFPQNDILKYIELTFIKIKPASVNVICHDRIGGLFTFDNLRHPLGSIDD